MAAGTAFDLLHDAAARGGPNEYTLYCHLDTRAQGMVFGRRVRQGEEIGQVGSTGVYERSFE